MRCCLKHSFAVNGCVDCQLEAPVDEFAATPAFLEQLEELQMACLSMYQRLSRVSVVLEILTNKKAAPDSSNAASAT